MIEHTPDEPVAQLSRRALLGRLAALAAGTFVAGCTPARVVLRIYASEFDESALSDRLLRAFVSTVIPGVRSDAEHLTRVFYDPYFPFAPRVGFFVADLSERSERLFGNRAFAELSRAQRVRVINDGLSADGITRKLYNGAVLLAQVSFYAGIYDDDRGCKLIGFDGTFQGKAPGELTYSDLPRFTARELTASGNAA